jgi:hypothetical protein
MPGYTMCVSKFNKKNLTSPDQAHEHGTSSKVNELPVNHLKSLRPKNTVWELMDLDDTFLTVNGPPVHPTQKLMDPEIQFESW